MTLYYRNNHLIESLLSNTHIHLFQAFNPAKLTLGFDIQLAAIY